MNETYETIADWAIKTFGKPVGLVRGVERAAEEYGELLDATYDEEGLERVGSEMADVIIVLAHTALSNNINLQEAINKKMAINRKRDWSIRGDGTAQHVK